MYKIKQIPEDFYVEEKMDLEFKDDGQYSYYLLEKRNYTTHDAILAIAKVLGLKSNFINSAGLKDKFAVTKQNVSVYRGPKKNLELKDIRLTFLGKGDSRLNVGSLNGNFFSIIVRNISAQPKRVNVVPNYFDSQRFGMNKDNHIIGKLLIKRKFREAIDYFSENSHVKEHIEKNPTDFIGALRRLPKRELQFYISAYQSYLWNQCIERFLFLSSAEGDSKIKAQKYIGVEDNSGFELKFPVIGFNLELQDNTKKQIVDEVLENESLSPRDFIVRQFPEISADSYERKIYAQIYDLDIGALEEDELNQGMKKVRVDFFLEKGNYATNVIKYMFI